jgi:hemoglobin-like flavoprotein
VILVTKLRWNPNASAIVALTARFPCITSDRYAGLTPIFAATLRKEDRPVSTLIAPITSFAFAMDRMFSLKAYTVNLYDIAQKYPSTEVKG